MNTLKSITTQEQAIRRAEDRRQMVLWAFYFAGVAAFILLLFSGAADIIEIYREAAIERAK